MSVIAIRTQTLGGLQRTAQKRVENASSNRNSGAMPYSIRGHALPPNVLKALKELDDMASGDKLGPYEGPPQEIINDGLLWNDQRSRCSIGDDETLRQYLFELSNAWRLSDRDKVRYLMQKIKDRADIESRPDNGNKTNTNGPRPTPGAREYPDIQSNRRDSNSWVDKGRARRRQDNGNRTDSNNTNRGPRAKNVNIM